MLCCAMLCYAMLCYAMLCYAMLCYAMLCYAMLCYAMLCYAMLCGMRDAERRGATRSAAQYSAAQRAHAAHARHTPKCTHSHSVLCTVVPFLSRGPVMLSRLFVPTAWRFFFVPDRTWRFFLCVVRRSVARVRCGRHLWVPSYGTRSTRTVYSRRTSRYVVSEGRDAKRRNAQRSTARVRSTCTTHGPSTDTYHVHVSCTQSCRFCLEFLVVVL